MTLLLRGLEHLFYADRLRERGLLTQQKRRSQEDLTAAFQSLKGAPKEAGEELFRKSYRDRMGGGGG